MKITNAWVVDPALQGDRELPYLTVEVDEFPSVTIGPDSFSGGWILSKSGPFVTYTQHDPGALLPSDIDAGDFNKRFSDRFPVVVDIVLMFDGNAVQGYSLPLSRARSLLRKYAPDWRLLLDDRAAAHGGKLLWRPVQTNPGCRWWVNNQTCNSRPARMIPIEGIEIPMCGTHVELYNKSQAARRAARAS